MVCQSSKTKEEAQTGFLFLILVGMEAENVGVVALRGIHFWLLARSEKTAKFTIKQGM
jgi:hypothetical protein